MTSFSFRPAKSFNERHGLFVALVGGTNSGKTFSALRLARGIAGPQGKIAVLDTEGGRTLHLKDDFDFDVMVMGPPHRPMRYLEAAQAAQDAGFNCLVIDSFTMAWRGLGGVLDWTDDKLSGVIERKRSYAAEKGWSFNEDIERQKNKQSASIEPKMAWKLMVSGFLGLRIPIIFSIRGEVTLDQDTKKEAFKAQIQKNFPFEVTVSFRLSTTQRGVIDLSQPELYKMEKAHQSIFRDGEQISEAHGAALDAWARGESKPIAEPELPVIAPDGRMIPVRKSVWLRSVQKALGGLESITAVAGWRTSMGPLFGSISESDPELVAQAEAAIEDRKQSLAVEGAAA